MCNIPTANVMTEKAKEIYFNVTGEEFKGYVVWSNRMINTAGNCRADGRIALNLKYYQTHGLEEMLNVVKHELTHWYCFCNDLQQSHSSKDFLSMLQRFGGTLYGKSMPYKGFLYKCPYCQKEWILKDRLVKEYACGECHDKKGQCKSIVFMGEKIFQST